MAEGEGREEWEGGVGGEGAGGCEGVRRGGGWVVEEECLQDSC